MMGIDVLIDNYKMTGHNLGHEIRFDQAEYKLDIIISMT